MCKTIVKWEIFELFEREQFLETDDQNVSNIDEGQIPIFDFLNS